ncbi:FAD-binding oxidoreductase [Agromyces cerinus]|uniref:FAD/FMN-containing dehydrogenase n=1 Tax=Agromyces cerinus subsp. cerinus TaxID=232089 RepID=A0A1N6I9R5_9MICO|nr:FAD-binding oxidoreductase [Agromyces cerinus]SIO28719.1 FAD/FMN-containing dehydrogenase [Agromyces cerinus subsp. cerinus]
MTSASELLALRSELGGSLVLPDDADYETARQPWNLSVDQRPAAIAEPADVADLQAILRTAAATGLGVTVQPNGHGASGDLHDVVLVRPTRFDTLIVDEQARVLRAGAGVNWGRALERLDGTGLVALAGSNPEVNVVALAIAGGHSMFSRRYGITARSIISVEFVDAAGTLHRVTDADDAELMWALRGGGGLFGIVTEVELVLYPGEAIFGGSLMFPAEAAEAVVTAALELARDEPELGLDIGMMRFPEAPQAPPHLRGRTVASVGLVHVGDEASGRAFADRIVAVAEPIADTLTSFTIGSLAAVAAEPVDPMPSADFGAALDGFDAAFAHDFVDAFLRGADLGLMRCSVRAMGGAIADELGAEFAAVGATQADGLMSCSVLLFDPSLDADAAFGPMRDLAAKYPGGTVLPTFLSSGATLADAYDQEVLDRLAAVKQRVDPGGVIRSNRPLD